MPDIKDYYQILGLPVGASIKEVQQAYRDLVKVWHPDRFGHDPKLQRKAEEELKKINNAYEQIINFLDNLNRSRQAQGSATTDESKPDEKEETKKESYSPPPKADKSYSGGHSDTTYKFPFWKKLVGFVIGGVIVLLLRIGYQSMTSTTPSQQTVSATSTQQTSNNLAEQPFPVPNTHAAQSITPDAPVKQEGRRYGNTTIIDHYKWSAVVLTIFDKSTGDFIEPTIKTNSTFDIPNTTLRVEVKEFLPNFIIRGLLIWSLSNELNNPAVHVVVHEANQVIFKGWLYEKFPAIHPFEHPRYSIILKNGIQ